VADQLDSPQIEEAKVEEAPVNGANEEQDAAEISPAANENIEDEDEGLDL
jgi:hypothetical protein